MKNKTKLVIGLGVVAVGVVGFFSAKKLIEKKKRYTEETTIKEKVVDAVIAVAPVVAVAAATVVIAKKADDHSESSDGAVSNLSKAISTSSNVSNAVDAVMDISKPTNANGFSKMFNKFKNQVSGSIGKVTIRENLTGRTFIMSMDKVREIINDNNAKINMGETVTVNELLGDFDLPNVDTGNDSFWDSCSTGLITMDISAIVEEDIPIIELNLNVPKSWERY